MQHDYPLDAQLELLCRKRNVPLSYYMTFIVFDSVERETNCKTESSTLEYKGRTIESKAIAREESSGTHKVLRVSQSPWFCWVSLMIRENIT
jgi:hypothetical protein